MVLTASADRLVPGESGRGLWPQESTKSTKWPYLFPVRPALGIVPRKRIPDHGLLGLHGWIHSPIRVIRVIPAAAGKLWSILGGGCSPRHAVLWPLLLCVRGTGIGWGGSGLPFRMAIVMDAISVSVVGSSNVG